MLRPTRYCQPLDHFDSALPQMWTSPALINSRAAHFKGVKTGGLWTVNGVIIAAEYRKRTLDLMIITCSQSGTNDYVVSYLLLRFVFSFTTFLVFSNPKPALLLKKTGNVCTQRTKECVFKGWKQETKELSAGHKKDRFQILPLTWRMSGGTGVSVSAVSQIKPTLMKRPSQIRMTFHFDWL